MKTMGWSECCRKCGGKASVEMTTAGEAVSGCWLCGLSETWNEPSGETVVRGGSGCSWFGGCGVATLSTAMSLRALDDAWRRLSGKARVGRRIESGRISAVSKSLGGGRWLLKSAVGGRREWVWVCRAKKAVVLCDLLMRRGWSKDVRVRLQERGLADSALMCQFKLELVRGRAADRMLNESPALEDEDRDHWVELPV